MAKELKLEVNLAEEDLIHIIESLEWATSGYEADSPEQQIDFDKKYALQCRMEKSLKRLQARKG